MKNKFTYLGLVMLSFGMIACDGGSDDSTDPGTPTTLTILPPTDLTPAATEAAEDTTEVTDLTIAELEDLYEAAIFDAINAERVALGLNELELDPDLVALVDEHNTNMQVAAALTPETGIEISHDNFSDRATAAIALGYVVIAENVGGVRGFAQDEVAPALLNGWNNSPGHRANIEGEFSNTGIAVLVDPADGTIYATQIFTLLP